MIFTLITSLSPWIVMDVLSSSCIVDAYQDQVVDMILPPLVILRLLFFIALIRSVQRGHHDLTTTECDCVHRMPVLPFFFPGGG